MSAPESPQASPPYEPTLEQQAAIDTMGRNLYVTAAAGSGKTAVLTERVVRLVSEPRPPLGAAVELERLLVITFTRKAAQEMRERIEEKIRKGLEARPENSALRAALDALPRSHIMTIDAFCDRVVRRHFHLAGVPPTVRLADEDEEREIVHNATREVFEASASGKAGLDAEAFANLLRSTPPSRGQGILESLERRVDRLRAYVASLEDGAGWMAATRRTLEKMSAVRSLADFPDAAPLARELRLALGELAEASEALLAAAGLIAEGIDRIPCGAAWRAATARLKAWSKAPALGESEDFSALWAQVRAWAADSDEALLLKKLHNKKNCGARVYDTRLTEPLKKLGEYLERLNTNWFTLGPERAAEAERLAGQQGLALLELAEAVEERSRALKRRRGLMSFSDMQRKALDLLTEGGGPSAVARDYQAFFEYVLVDEYQDVSPLQDALIRRVSREADPAVGLGGNLFIVGDVKQSIYRFRQAEPILFRSRLDEGRDAPDGVLPRTLSLSTNFRSRSDVLDAVNRVFEGLMDRRIGDVDMTGDALLNPGRADDAALAAPCVELRWIDPNGASDGAEVESDSSAEDEDAEPGDGATAVDLRGIEAEARWIAARIRELGRCGEAWHVPDKEAPNGRRPIRPSDCAVLVRSLAGAAEAWVAEFARWGIAVRTAGGESLWGSTEGADLLAALQLVDHPLDDLALATTLRSPLFGFSDDELLELRMADRHGPFWNAVWHAAGRAGVEASPSAAAPELSADLRGRVDKFFACLDRWRAVARTAPAEAVLDAILEDTAYEAHLLGGPRADIAIRNVDELRERMRTREAHASHAAGLTDFLRALQAEGGRADDREDETLRSNPEALQLMTIHKSKGLEFPVVFVARMAQPYAREHAAQALLFSPSGSLALAGVDPRRKVRLEPLSLGAMLAAESRALRGEELRLLYVAMTRARERLVLVGSARGLARHREPLGSLMELGTPAPALARLRANSAAALVGPRLYGLAREASPPPWLLLHGESALASPPERKDLGPVRDYLSSDGDETKRQLALAAFPQPSATAAQAPGLPRLASRAAETLATPMKFSPSRLRPGNAPTPGEPEDADPDPDPARLFDEDEMRPVRAGSGGLTRLTPKFARAAGEGPDPRARGSLTHAFLQHVDLRGPLDEPGLRAQAESLRERRILVADEDGLLDRIPFRQIADFFVSPLGRRLAARPGAVSREVPFTRGLLGADLPAGVRSSGRIDDRRMVLVQGTVDCILDEGDDVTIIDYKTDRVRGAEDVSRLAAEYGEQLRQYAGAIRAAWSFTQWPRAYLVLLEAGEIVEIGKR